MKLSSGLWSTIKKERSRLFLGHEGFAVSLWHSEGGTPRQEALMVVVVKQARTTKHLWLVACDATMDPTDIERGLWLKEKFMFMEPPEAIVTICRATGSNGEFLERTYYYERISKSLQGNIKTSDVRLFSCGHRLGRFRKCTSSKCRKVFQASVAVLLWFFLCIFEFFCFWWYVCFFGMCVFVLCCGFFVVVCRKRC